MSSYNNLNFTPLETSSGQTGAHMSWNFPWHLAEHLLVSAQMLWKSPFCILYRFDEYTWRCEPSLVEFFAL